MRDRLIEDDPKKERRSTSAGSGSHLLILLLLLISAALNFYLWFLARSFHSRYNELAHELRETFTATT